MTIQFWGVDNDGCNVTHKRAPALWRKLEVPRMGSEIEKIQPTRVYRTTQRLALVGAEFSSLSVASLNNMIKQDEGHGR